MMIPIKNCRSMPVKLTCNTPDAVLDLPPDTIALVTLDDGMRHPIHIFDERIDIWNEGEQSAKIELIPRPPGVGDDHPYGGWGQLVNPAEAQYVVLRSLHDNMVDASDLQFSKSLVDNLKQIYLRLKGEFDERYPGHGDDPTIWR
jgi:hypothetical protein